MSDLLGSSGTADWVLLTAFHSLWLTIAAFLIIRLRRFRAPAVRSAWCAFTLILLLILPVITWAAPRIRWHARPVSNASVAAIAQTADSEAPLLNSLPGLKTLSKARMSQWRAATNLIGLLWLAVTLGCLGRLLYELAFLKGYCTGQQEVEDDRISTILQEINESIGFRKKPRFFVSPNLTSPVSMGMRTPLVLFPSNLYPTVGDGELRAILLHELAHIYHYDHVLGLLQRIVKALYWWNPLVYRLCSDLSLAREEVSDNYAISGMKSASGYAALLVSLIEKTSLINRLPCTAGMATPYESLETRIKNIVSKERDMRVKTTKPMQTLIAFTAALFFGLVAIGSQGKVFGEGAASSAGQPKPVQVDITNTAGFQTDALQGSTLLLEGPNGTRYESSPIRVNGSRGSCEFSELISPGQYKLVMTIFGLKADVSIPPTPYPAATLHMSIGPGRIAIYADMVLRNESTEEPQTTPIKLGASDTPVVLSRVELEYPPDAKLARISGTVTLEVVVNEKGDVYEAKLRSGHPMFHQAALNAAVQWKFQPPMLNGVPKPFITTVALDFHY